MREIPQTSARVELETGEVLFRDLDLAEGDFLHAIAWQEGVDVAWRLSGANGEELLFVDSPNGRFGPEELLFLAPSAGRYRLELVAAANTPPPGAGCRLEIDTPRAASEGDAAWVAADSYLRQGRERLKAGDAREALAPLDLALATFAGMSRERGEADAKTALAEAEEALGLFEPALARIQGAIQHYRKSNDLHRLPLLVARAGLLELRLGRVGAAKSALERARVLSQEQGDEVAWVKSLATLGTAHRLLGARGSAEQAFAEAVPVIERLNLPELEAELLYERGTAHLDWKQPAEAGADLARAEQLWQSTSRSWQLPLAWIGLAEAAGDRDEYTAAELWLAKALDKFGEQHRWREGAVAWFARAELYRKQGNLDAAWAAYEEARAEAHEMKDQRTEALAVLGSGYCRHLLGDAAAGLSQMLEARQVLGKVGDPVMERRALARAAEALRTLGRGQEADALEAEPLLATTAAEEAARRYSSIEDPDAPPAPVIVARTGLPGEGENRVWGKFRHRSAAEHRSVEGSREVTDAKL